MYVWVEGGRGHRIRVKAQAEPCFKGGRLHLRAVEVEVEVEVKVKVDFTCPRNSSLPTSLSNSAIRSTWRSASDVAASRLGSAAAIAAAAA